MDHTLLGLACTIQGLRGYAWRDVKTNILSTYAIIFHTLENEGVLDVDNEVYLFCLHRHVSLPRIQESLQNQGWNHNALSTECGWSPMQLFTAYSLP